MSLIEKLATPPPRREPTKSAMDVWVESLPEAEADAVLVAAVNPEWGHTALQRELVAAGAPRLAESSFRGWRIKVGYGS